MRLGSVGGQALPHLDGVPGCSAVASVAAVYSHASMHRPRVVDTYLRR